MSEPEEFVAPEHFKYDVDDEIRRPGDAPDRVYTVEGRYYNVDSGSYIYELCADDGELVYASATIVFDQFEEVTRDDG